jgi:hypothetical protein
VWRLGARLHFLLTTGVAEATCAMELVPDAADREGAAARAGTASGAKGTALRFTRHVRPKKIKCTGIVALKLVVTSSGWKLLDTSPEHRLPVRARATIMSPDGSIRVSEVPFLLLSPRRRRGGG